MLYVSHFLIINIGKKKEGQISSKGPTRPNIKSSKKEKNAWKKLQKYAVMARCSECCRYVSDNFEENIN